MLPRDVCAYVTMHKHLPEYTKFADLKKFALKYVKVISSLNRTAKQGVHLVDRSNGYVGPHDQGEGELYDDWEQDEEEEIPEGFEEMDADKKVECLDLCRSAASSHP